MALYSVDSLTRRVSDMLVDAGASRDMADSTARALVAAEGQGMRSHGLARAGQYAAHLRSGRVNGHAHPVIVRSHGAGVLVDADEGLAYPACDLAIKEAIQRAREFSVAFAGVTRSHHFGVARLHLDAVADSGMVGFAFSNSPAAMPAWGGTRALFGTNPVAAVFPRKEGDAISIDMSLSEVARGKVMVAAREGRQIPLGWALDKEGHPTTDPVAGLSGMMCPAGGVKGTMLALMVELLCVSLTGAAFGFEADSFFDDRGNRPHIGHAFLVIDPSALSGRETYLERIETLLRTMLTDHDVRIPGGRRAALARKSRSDGIEVPDQFLQDLAA
jgi:(2R)-3-sulfolactate dehydrogenase (NADP+)